MRTLQDILDRAAAQMAFTMVLVAIAAGVSLTLGVVGIYGAMSYIVTQRTGEIGVRLALGAEPGNVVRMIAQQGGIVALAGITVGLAASFAGGRLIESLLYGVSPRDPGVLALLRAPTMRSSRQTRVSKQPVNRVTPLSRPFWKRVPLLWHCQRSVGGGRAWWAHFEFTRMKH